MKYNLNSMTDRSNFDEKQIEYAEAMLNALSEEEALHQEPKAYAEVGWEAFEIDLEAGAVEVNDLEEAKARFFWCFSHSVIEWQAKKTGDKLEDELYLKQTGYKTSIEVIPGGQKDGLNYGPSVIDVVVLDEDGAKIAYRYSDDSIDQDWAIGSIEDVVEEAVDYRHQHFSTQKEIEEEAYA